jgi:alkanesulfonate monooxygenase SsuD/methylene tetrahydromethanopterin reductase-like flavin-dependent oxidoreductase (luciferase family)
LTRRRELRFGLWYDFRNPARWRQQPPALYAACLDQIARAEALGWDDMWLSEHHAVDGGSTPAVLLLAAAVATRTTRMRIGTGALPLPLYDPLRVAEDAANLDLLSDGRFELGVAAGGARAKSAGTPRTERGSRMDEALPILRQLLAGERVSVEGRHYRYRDVELHPRPVQGRLPLWIGGLSEPAARRAARLGDGYLANGPVTSLIEVCRHELGRVGRDPASFGFAAGYPWLLVSRHPERRWQQARDHLPDQIELHASWFARAGRSPLPFARGEADLRRRGVLIVSPEQAMAQIESYVHATGVQRFFGWTVPPGLAPEWSDEHLELMARSVMPGLR